MNEASPKVDEAIQIRVEDGPALVESCQSWPNAARVRPTAAQLWAKPARIAPNAGQFVCSRPNFCRTQPCFVRRGPRPESQECGVLVRTYALAAHIC